MYSKYFGWRICGARSRALKSVGFFVVLSHRQFEHDGGTLPHIYILNSYPQLHINVTTPRKFFFFFFVIATAQAPGISSLFAR